jgi:SAM-dependent methyltransferase
LDLKEFRQHAGSRHPWERARAQFIARIFGKVPGLELDVLDVGSGDAWLAHQLIRSDRRIRNITCWDTGYTPQDIAALQQWRDPRLNLVTAVPDKKFDVILLCDVLEHIQNDREFLTHILQTHLKNSGWIVATVPEWQFLFTEHDVALDHFRRYSPRSARRLMTDCGLTPIATGQMFMIAFFVRCLEKLKQTFFGHTIAKVEGWTKGPILTQILAQILFLDAVILQVLVWIPGLSWWGVCQKRPS